MIINWSGGTQNNNRNQFIGFFTWVVNYAVSVTAITHIHKLFTAQAKTLFNTAHVKNLFHTAASKYLFFTSEE